MKIIVDAMSGDNAPLEIIKGSALAVKELGIEILLVGDENIINKCIEENNIDNKAMTILHTDAPPIIMEDDAKAVLKEKADSSMAVALKALADGLGDGMVSAGNTGALTVGTTFIVKRIKGIKRPAIASIMPTIAENPVLLMDCGANVECRSDVLNQFGLMGSVYMKKIMNIVNPRICLANNGTEETKGTPVLQEAYQIMKNEKYNFCGNIEARQIPYGDCDVVVADGFTGNIILKMYEGVAAAIMKCVKGIFMKNLKSKLAALMLKDGIGELKKQMDYKEYGGAVLLGAKQVVVKAHGSSDERSFKCAIRQAVKFADTGVIEEITKLASVTQE